MAIKDYLRGIKRRKNSIKILESNIERLRNLAEYKPPTINEIGGGMGTPNPHSREELMCRLADLTTELDKMRLELVDEIEIGIRMITSLSNADAQMIFSMRYLEDKTWERIATDMDLSFQWVHEIHKKGLIELGRKYPRI